jgi:uncharacterized protein YneF (UPF0154 family)
MSLKGLLLTLLVGAASGAGGGYYITLRLFQVELLSRPPIAVIDMATVITGTPDQPGEAVGAKTGRVLLALRAKAGKLAQAGYIVLDAQAVIEAPEDLYVPAD